MEKNKKKIINYVVMIVVFLLGVFVLGPLAQSYVIDPMKPYIIVDRADYIKASTSDCKSCDLTPVVPIEMNYTGLDLSNIPQEQTMISIKGMQVRIMNIPLERAPAEYKPYIHYPASWSEWWNPFQPNGIGPPLRIALNILVPISAVAVLIYGIIVWRRGGFKEFMRKLKP